MTARPTCTPSLSPDAHALLQRRLLALNDGDMVVRDWDLTFIQSVCWRKPETLTLRQRDMVQLLCWRYRAQLPSGLAPDTEPKLAPKPERRDRSFEPGPRNRQRGLKP